MRLFFALLLTITIISCEDPNSFKLQGSAQGFEDGTSIVVYKIENNQPIAIDTMTVKGEKFSTTFPKSDEVTLNYLVIEGANIIFFPENENLKAAIFKDSIEASYVTGSQINESYIEFSKKLREFNDKKMESRNRFQQARTQQDGELIAQIQQENLALIEEENNYKKQFIADNNNSVFSVMLLSEMVNRKEMTSVEADKYLKNLTPKVAAAKITQDVKKVIESMKGSDIGGVAPQFSAPSPDGSTVSLKDAMGKYTLIDFWASWCRPCRVENPNVVNVYNKYHDKGFNIISVSLDKEGQKDKWIKAIEDDKMDWFHVSNLQFWQDPIARMYSVRSIPATFLVDENGTIIAKDLRGPALEAKISSLLGQ